ncbi:DUF2239 family protein [Geothrix oryzisoli]|uniref:DUF2239 family protein n=1 Tax=Geothrix oryzisoli TaxID=2922721 RepID=UPI001FAE0A2C|nr:DUF2239 family protein [Geothrix oryzisoli]
MPENPVKLCTAFQGTRRLASGPLPEVALAVKAALDQGATAPLLTFEDATGRVVDLDLRGTAEAVVARLSPPGAGREEAAALPPRGRGRPKLGVVAREVTLLPRHWDWLNAQPGGASVALRRLVEEARQASGGKERRREAQEAAHRFMTAMAGDEPGFEEALRALYAGSRETFQAILRAWPADVGDHAWRLAGPAFPAEEGGAHG